MWTRAGQLCLDRACLSVSFSAEVLAGSYPSPLPSASPLSVGSIYDVRLLPISPGFRFHQVSDEAGLRFLQEPGHSLNFLLTQTQHWPSERFATWENGLSSHASCPSSSLQTLITISQAFILDILGRSGSKPCRERASTIPENNESRYFSSVLPLLLLWQVINHSRIKAGGTKELCVVPLAQRYGGRSRSLTCTSSASRLPRHNHSARFHMMIAPYEWIMSHGSLARKRRHDYRVFFKVLNVFVQLQWEVLTIWGFERLKPAITGQSTTRGQQK